MNIRGEKDLTIKAPSHGFFRVPLGAFSRY
jgi:hypothetical protein